MGLSGTQKLLLLLSITLYFLFTVSPSDAERNASLNNLLLLGSIANLALVVVKGNRLAGMFSSGGRSFTRQASLGVVWGLITTVLISVLMPPISGAIRNLFGNYVVPAGAFSLGDAFFANLIQPITETILIITALTLAFDLFKSDFKVPFPKVAAVLAVAVLFSALHFVAVGRGNFEYSFNGFQQFVLSPQGALPQLLMGLMWLALAVVYGEGAAFNAIIPAVAHLVNNFLAALGLGGGLNFVVLGVGALLGLWLVQGASNENILGKVVGARLGKLVGR